MHIRSIFIYVIDCIRIYIDDIVIKKVNYCKFLGVVIDEHLTWKNHIEVINSKISKNIGVIFRVRHILPKAQLYALYCTLILPYLTYCNIIWGCTYFSRLQTLILKQKRVIRIVTGSKYRDHTSLLFKNLFCLKFTDLVEFSVAIMMFKVYNNKVPPNVNNIFFQCSKIHNYNTKRKKNFYVLSRRTKAREFSISCRGPKIWNNLDEKIKSAKSVFIFKINLKRKLVMAY